MTSRTRKGDKSQIAVFWFRRDLRLDDNAGLYHALKSGLPVLPIFIWDTNLLATLSEKNDARVTFIYQNLKRINDELLKFKSSLVVKHATPVAAFDELINQFNISLVFTNNDYEPYGRERDNNVVKLLTTKGISFHSFKDHVIFEKDEILKANGLPYTVFTPYSRVWHSKVCNTFYTQAYPSANFLGNLYHHTTFKLPPLPTIGFEERDVDFPQKDYQHMIDTYSQTRDSPSLSGTTRIGVHLRYGTISIRRATHEALKAADKTWLTELIWRDFYAMILWHFPHTVNHAFKPVYERIRWRNDEAEFEAWCEGRTGYPIVDAGMRELNATGFMHNRVRMIAASFLTKHLLIDWRWGEAYFAQKLLDYDQASNVGGWQWAAGTGNDAAPYFRIFNPQLQTKRFDPELKYIRQWVPEFDDPLKYPQPIVDHRFARERALRAYKEALQD